MATTPSTRTTRRTGCWCTSTPGTWSWNGPAIADSQFAPPVYPPDYIGEVFRGAIGDILSLTIEGSDDRDLVTVSDVGGLPTFSGSVPTTKDNPNVHEGHIGGSATNPLRPNMLFNARSPNGAPGDALNFTLDADNNGPTYDQVYGLGDGLGGGFGMDIGHGRGRGADV